MPASRLRSIERLTRDQTAAPALVQKAGLALPLLIDQPAHESRSSRVVCFKFVQLGEKTLLVAMGNATLSG